MADQSNLNVCLIIDFHLLYALESPFPKSYIFHTLNIKNSDLEMFCYTYS